SLTAHTDYLKVGDFAVRELSLGAEEQTLTSGQLQLAIGEITLPGATLNNIELAMNGGPAPHQVDVSLALDDQSTLARAPAAAPEAIAGHGDITHWRITSGGPRLMLLKQPVALPLSASQVDMDCLCLVDTSNLDQVQQTHL